MMYHYRSEVFLPLFRTLSSHIKSTLKTTKPTNFLLKLFISLRRGIDFSIALQPQDWRLRLLVIKKVIKYVRLSMFWSLAQVAVGCLQCLYVLWVYYQILIINSSKAHKFTPITKVTNLEILFSLEIRLPVCWWAKKTIKINLQKGGLDGICITNRTTPITPTSS